MSSSVGNVKATPMAGIHPVDSPYAKSMLTRSPGCELVAAGGLGAGARETESTARTASALGGERSGSTTVMTAGARVTSHGSINVSSTGGWAGASVVRSMRDRASADVSNSPFYTSL